MEISLEIAESFFEDILGLTSQSHHWCYLISPLDNKNYPWDRLQILSVDEITSRYCHGLFILNDNDHISMYIYWSFLKHSDWKAENIKALSFSYENITDQQELENIHQEFNYNVDRSWPNEWTVTSYEFR